METSAIETAIFLVQWTTGIDTSMAPQHIWDIPNQSETEKSHRLGDQQRRQHEERRVERKNPLTLAH